MKKKKVTVAEAKKISMNVFSPILSFFQAFFSSLHTNQNTETRLFSGEGKTTCQTL